MVNNYVNVLRKYADFSGRARRYEYWMFCLANIIIGFILGLLPFVGTVLSALYSLVVLIPSLALCVRRLHDIGKSGWYYFIGLIPLVGGILILIWFCTDSNAEPNQWGPSPKYAAPAVAEEEEVPSAENIEQ
ncbi:MAG: DUF805 domain-containing protein [Clostridia bacterium]|nr:DUF805 domain-containing protein [Clostridia bacterium]